MRPPLTTLLLLALLGLVVLPTLAADETKAADATERPNVVFIVSEDNSIHYLRHFFPGGAACPNIEALAAHGFTFDHAFSNGPVCSVARTTLATGCYGPRIGTQFHRRYANAPLGGGRRMFHGILRDAGYYCTNRSKQDYNTRDHGTPWDKSSGNAHWRNRPDPAQPFFHMESHATSHEGRLHFSRESYENDAPKHDPAAVPLAPYFPDTPLFRTTHARYLDQITAIDDIVGKVTNQLREDGLLDSTFIFYFGDHGGVLPRGKGYIYESGLHVPLVVRVPKNFNHLVPPEFHNGTRIPGFVEFIDFGPTVLSLASLPTPDTMDGTPFLGPGLTADAINARDETFGYADRFDEKYDLLRSLRKGKFQYIRAYQPYLPDGLNNNYRYKMLAFAEWRDLHNAGKLTGAPAAFFEEKPVELLFDCEADPHQVTNLAADPAHRDTLRDLRARLQTRLKAMPDLSFYPESHLVNTALKTDDPAAWGQTQKAEIATLIDTADLALLPFADAEPKLRAALASENHHARFWAATACAAFGETARPLAGAANPLLEDSSNPVRNRAADFLGLIDAINPQDTLRDIVNTATDAVEVTEALNSVVLFHDHHEYKIDVTTLTPKATGADVMDRINYLNGTPYPPKKRKKKK